jgi:hypothetical protein
MDKLAPLTDHQIPGTLNGDIVITPSEIGGGGAPTVYDVKLKTDNADFWLMDIHFQNGDPTKQINGVTMEVLIAIVIHRLESFQNGPFPDPDNLQAITHLKNALSYLQRRTKERLARGVEGKQTT